MIDDLFTMSEIIQCVANKGDAFLQIAFSFYFHNPIPIENLLILSHCFSTEIIRQRERKINGFTEKLTNKPNNISMKQARRHTTIQLDIIHTGGCLEILKILPDSSVHCCMTFPPYLTLPFFQRCNIVRIEVSSGVYAAVNLTDI